MRAISLWQPWATLLVIEAKLYETRSWALPPSLQGQVVAIHAAQRWTPDQRMACHANEQAILKALRDHGYGIPGVALKYLAHRAPCPEHKLPLGAIVGTVEFGICHDSNVWHPTREQLPFGDFSPDRFAWEAKNVQQFDKPVPAKGNQGVWNWEGK